MGWYSFTGYTSPFLMFIYKKSIRLDSLLRNVTILGQAIRNVLWKWTVLRKNAVWSLESWRRHYFSFFENQLSTCSLTIKTLYIMA